MERGIFQVWVNSACILMNRTILQRAVFLKDSLVIVFSVSGESGDTIRHVMRFKEQNCRILSITNTENCTIAKLSDHNIAYYVSYMRLGDYDVTTQIPAVSIVERLGKKLYRYTSKGPGAI